MTRIIIILLLVLPLGVDAQTIEAPVTMTGTASIKVPADNRIEALEKEVAGLKKQIEKLTARIEAMGRIMVIPADAAAVPLETLLK